MLIQCARLHETNTPLITEEAELAPPLSDQVTVKIHFAGINYYEFMLIKGRYPIKSGLPLTVGGELSGEVVAVGDKVKDFHVGDRVFSFAQTGHGTTGSYATYANVNIEYLYHLPEFLSFESGAAFPMIFFTAHTMLTQRVHVTDSSVILVHSAAGGVGSTLVQLIRVLYPKVTIIGTYSDAKKEQILKDMGVDISINMLSQDLFSEITQKFPSGIDIIFDPVGKSLVDTHLKLMKSLSSIWCSYGAYSGVIDDANLVGKLRSKNGTLAGFLMWPLIENKAWCQNQFSRIMTIMKEHRLLPKIDKIFSLTQVNQAFHRLEERKNIGKILLSCSQN